jgi:arginase family enzyme
MVEMRDFAAGAVPIPDAPLYISLDLDALDPAFAPGVSHHEPGGLSVRDLLNVLHRIKGPIIGADVVEYNPTRDINGMTAVVAAKFLKELAGLAG